MRKIKVSELTIEKLRSLDCVETLNLENMKSTDRRDEIVDEHGSPHPDYVVFWKGFARRIDGDRVTLCQAGIDRETPGYVTITASDIISILNMLACERQAPEDTDEKNAE